MNKKMLKYKHKKQKMKHQKACDKIRLEAQKRIRWAIQILE